MRDGVGGDVALNNEGVDGKQSALLGMREQYIDRKRVDGENGEFGTEMRWAKMGNTKKRNTAGNNERNRTGKRGRGV